MSRQRKRKQVGHSNGCTSDDDSAKRLCVDHAPHDSQKQYPSSTVALESTPGSAEVDQQDMLRSKDFDDSSSEDEDVVTHDFDTCFGMVRIPTSHLRLSVLLDSCDPSVEVALKIEGDIITIRNSTSLEYGGLLGRNTAGSRALKQLYHQHGANFEGYLLQKETKSSGKNAYGLHVIVYGTQSQSDSFSKLLDSAGLFLQHPHLRDLSAPYRNPHYLCNPHSQIDLIEETRSTMSETITTKVAQVLEDSDPLKHHLLEVIDSAQGPETYSSTSTSPRLRTPLKTHQTKALSMMREKESGRLEKNEFGSIWTTFQSKKGDLRYKNLVTGSVQINTPRICRGGLLADDMGLGKTLSTIALIASSLDIITHLPDDHVNCRSTLIVCPLSLLRQWESQILEHVHPGKMSYKIFHGASKQDASTVNGYDVVLTTYDVVVSEASKSSPGVTTIHSIEWHRVVLDEAHTIRNRRTKRYRKISALKARYRWCLTGTPIYNSLEDFGSLLGFLGVYPFDNAATFNSRIGIPVKNCSSQGLGTLQRLVQGVCLRRTKDAISHDLQLPACHKAVCQVQLSEKERRDYEVLKKNYAAILHTDSCANKAASSTTRIFLTLLRLRQFCDHGVDLLPSEIRELLENSADSEAYAKCLINPVQSCAACRKGLKQNAEDGAVFPLRDCGHVFCPRCEKKVRGKSPGQDAECIACARYTSEQRMGDKTEPRDDDRKPSSKVLALLRNLIEERDQASHHPIKSIVFSTWTSMLNLVEPALRREGFKFVRIDGGKSEIDRQSAIEKFRSEKNCNILLASIGTAGVGLDLTVASRVHLLEPQWTPMVEAQALDRVHRMGQTQDVIATRYIVENSIEEYLVNVQQVKSAVIGQLFTSKGKVEIESTRERLAKYLTEEAT